MAAVANRAKPSIDERTLRHACFCRGGFSIVKLAIRREDGHPFAIKIVSKKQLSPEKLKLVQNEVASLEQVRLALPGRLHE